MNIDEIKEKHKMLISVSNPEWRNIAELQKDVQQDFNENEYLSISTLTNILAWKIDKPAQIEKILAAGPGALVENITHCYYKTSHPDEEMNTRIKMHVLLSLPWVGIGISSAIMALHQPHLYGAIDARSWAVLFYKDKKTLSMHDYLRYLKRMRELAEKAECDILELDYILWKQHEAVPQNER